MLDQDDTLSGILVLTTPGALAAVVFAYPFVVWWNRSFPEAPVGHLDGGLILLVGVTVVWFSLRLFWRFIKALP
jgi:hypothetical protein